MLIFISLALKAAFKYFRTVIQIIYFKIHSVKKNKETKDLFLPARVQNLYTFVVVVVFISEIFLFSS